MGNSAPPLTDSGAVSYLGRGIYDIKEVARLLRRGMVPTHLLARLLDLYEPDEGDLIEVCDDYRLATEQVRAAFDYELALVA